MIYDGDLTPITSSEYHERLLAQTILLVLAAGGELKLSQSLLVMGDTTHHVLEQSKFDDGGVLLRVYKKSKP